MDVLPLNGRRELRESIELRFPRAPIIAGAPVVRQLLEILQRHTAAPTHVGQLVRPASARQPLMQIVQVCLRDLNAEGADGGVVSSSTLSVRGVGWRLITFGHVDTPLARSAQR